jgi:thioredoxin 1
MSFTSTYATTEPPRVEVDALAGTTVVEFGAPWCGHCIAAQPLLEAALARHPDVRHLKIEDGRGRPLGRSFRIKLWPTLVLLRDGEELARVVRPVQAEELDQLLAGIDR